jgi:hypothetical protein
MLVYQRVITVAFTTPLNFVRISLSMAIDELPNGGHRLEVNQIHQISWNPSSDSPEETVRALMQQWYVEQKDSACLDAGKTAGFPAVMSRF